MTSHSRSSTTSTSTTPAGGIASPSLSETYSVLSRRSTISYELLDDRSDGESDSGRDDHGATQAPSGTRRQLSDCGHHSGQVSDGDGDDDDDFVLIPPGSDLLSPRLGPHHPAFVFPPLTPLPAPLLNPTAVQAQRLEHAAEETVSTPVLPSQAPQLHLHVHLDVAASSTASAAKRSTTRRRVKRRGKAAEPTTRDEAASTPTPRVGKTPTAPPKVNTTSYPSPSPTPTPCTGKLRSEGLHTDATSPEEEKKPVSKSRKRKERRRAKPTSPNITPTVAPIEPKADEPAKADPPSKSKRRKLRRKVLQEAERAITGAARPTPLKDDDEQVPAETVYRTAVRYISDFLERPTADDSPSHSTRLALLRALIIELGIIQPTEYDTALPRSLTAASQLLRTRGLINIRDYVSVREDGLDALRRVMFPSRKALMRDVRKRRAPLNWVKERGLTMFLVAL